MVFLHLHINSCFSQSSTFCTTNWSRTLQCEHSESCRQCQVLKNVTFCVCVLFRTSKQFFLRIATALKMRREGKIYQMRRLSSHNLHGSWNILAYILKIYVVLLLHGAYFQTWHISHNTMIKITKHNSSLLHDLHHHHARCCNVGSVIAVVHNAFE